MPLLVEGTQLKYVPWGGRDVETLKSKLPSLRDGANRWIATFEDETVGDMIAVGDIKVLLSKVLTRQEMEDILKDAGMKDAVGFVMQFYMKLLFQLRELFVKDSILLD